VGHGGINCQCFSGVPTLISQLIWHPINPDCHHLKPTSGWAWIQCSPTIANNSAREDPGTGSIHRKFSKVPFFSHPHPPHFSSPPWYMFGPLYILYLVSEVSQFLMQYMCSYLGIRQECYLLPFGVLSLSCYQSHTYYYYAYIPCIVWQYNELLRMESYWKKTPVKKAPWKD
jgi:hypothetical protein